MANGSLTLSILYCQQTRQVMVNSLILVGIGGASGSILRYLFQRSFNLQFPYGTLSVNIIGCFVIGILWGIFSDEMEQSKKLLLITGLCGGFTTFSSFTHEGIQMLVDNRWFIFALYTISSVAGGLLATYVGYKLTS